MLSRGEKRYVAWLEDRSVATQGMAGVGDRYSDFFMTKHNDAGNEILKRQHKKVKHKVLYQIKTLHVHVLEPGSYITWISTAFSQDMSRYHVA